MQIDTDLVFDNLEQSNARHHHDNHPRIERDLSSEETDTSLYEEQDNWLLGSVKRLKRSISNLFNGKEEHSKQPVTRRRKSVEHHHTKKVEKNHSQSKAASRRKHRQAQNELGQQEADDYEEEVSTPFYFLYLK